MISTEQVNALMSGSGNVVGPDGEKVGRVGQVYLDNATQAPEWVTVKTGLFGTAESFVPLADATVDGENIRVPYGKAKIKDAPRIDDDGELSEGQEDELYRYYGLSSTNGTVDTDSTVDTDRTVDIDRTRTQGRDTSGPTTDDAMTRSEERLHVGTERQATGKARLRKYVVTEQVTQTVPVSHEEVRIEREPITDANRGQAMAGGDLTEEEHEVTLTAERPVVEKETVPVERVRLGTETVTEEQRVDESVRKEQIETDIPDVPESRR